MPMIDTQESPLPVISCDGCGACCMEIGSPPFIGEDDPDFQSLPDDVRHEFQVGLERRAAAGWPDPAPCFWFNWTTKRCMHYEHRPSICREFEIGSLACRGYRENYGISENG